MRIPIPLSLLALAACASTVPQRLATSSFRVDLVAADGTAPPDHVACGPGGFESAACRDYGIGAAPHPVTSEGGRTTFAATATSAQHGSTACRGTVGDGAIAGATVRTDPDGRAHRASFTPQTTR